MKKLHPFTLSILSGILLFLSWPVSPLTLLIFIAWAPLLLIGLQEKKPNRFFLHSYIAMLIWNAGSTWWIWNSTGPGATGAILANAALMCLPLWGFHGFNRKYGLGAGMLSFVVFWLGFEYIHLNWQLSWPWLTLGNVFANQSGWVQWYEYTGVSGGSLWVLLANVGVVMLAVKWKNRTLNANLTRSFLLAAAMAVPCLISFLIEKNLKPDSAVTTNVLIVQPNIDPYEKYASGTVDQQIEKLISLSEKNIDENTKLVIWPETALPIPVWQDQVEQNVYYQPVFDFVKRHPNLTLQTGIETYKSYGTEKATNTARKIETDGTYYDAFNAAVSISNNKPLQFYNKSKLVPGVETLPDFLIWMGDIFEKFGGTTGGYGKDKEANIFKNEGNPYITAPIICYESIYGEYVTNYVRKGANMLTIMTNDGWWANTPGHKQHLNYARLRAIETRKWIARSANTGISAVIDNKGNIVERKGWDETGVIKYNIPPITGDTFYVRNGAVIFNIALLLMGALILYNFVMLFIRRFNIKKQNLKP